MVSIMDWSRWRDMPEKPSKSPPPIGVRYAKQREQEIVRQAEEHGYFVTASRSVLRDKFLPETREEQKDRQRKQIFIYQRNENEEAASLEQIKMVWLPKARLRNVGDIGYCSHLQICDLSNNYLINVDALTGCKQLIYLDLHSNQVVCNIAS